VCCLLVLNLVTATPQWIRHPEPRDTELEKNLQITLLPSRPNFWTGMREVIVSTTIRE
jgi:hypothetical protein